jgi:hypothetical protein
MNDLFKQVIQVMPTAMRNNVESLPLAEGFRFKWMQEKLN